MDKNEVMRIYNEEYIGQHISSMALQQKYDKNFYYLFKKYGLKTRSFKDIKPKYACNESYFEVIDTEEKAYWLGFAMGDGYVSVPKDNCSKKFGISINSGDIKHLEKFKVAIESESPIHNYKVSQGYNTDSTYCRIIITSDIFVDNIISQGCVAHKSNILQPPHIDKAFRKHWIRGYMDANGSISITRPNEKSSKPSYKIKFCGTDDVLNWIIDELIDDGVIKRRYPLYKRKAEHIVSGFDFGGNTLSQKYLDYIYDGASVWLDRKHDRYLELIETNKKDKIGAIPYHKCDVCGAENSPRYLRWNSGDLKGKVLCQRHYNQMRTYGAIQKDKEDKCCICGDDFKLTLVGPKYPDYKGMTLCKKHYNQISKHNKIIDRSRGAHKNAR